MVQCIYKGNIININCCKYFEMLKNIRVLAIFNNIMNVILEIIREKKFIGHQKKIELCTIEIKRSQRRIIHFSLTWP